jgi:exodeoxyribonuclease VII large subunit
MPREWAGKPVYSVGEIVRILAGELEQAFPDVWIEGEVSNLRRAASGHCYFTLKDGEGSLKAVLFRTHALRVPFVMEAGQQVLARGRLSVYAGSGDLQLYVTAVEPAGLGALQMAFEQAKARLMADGLTDPARKRPIPPFPGRVAVVTSLQGAALRDVLSVLRRRGALFDVVVVPALVQGAEAPQSLRRGLTRAARVPGVQVVLLTRGGGSVEDLWAFNDETLARMVAACPVPVVSAVGHEVDTVLTDLTADLRAPTPSVAAELLTARSEGLREQVSQARRRLGHLAGSRLLRSRERLDRCRPERAAQHVLRRMQIIQEAGDRAAERAERATTLRLERAGHRLGRCRQALSPEGLRRWIAGLAGRFDMDRERLAVAGPARLARDRGRFANLARLLASLSPLGVLARGYAAAFDARGDLLTDAAALSPGDEVTLALGRGSVDCAVTATAGSHLPEALLRPAPGVDPASD